jgi:AcrR family transcriptional regulator
MSAKADRTRAAILNAAVDFLWTNPFRDMTVNSVMAPTGVGRSALYQYFKDLHALMETLLEMVRVEIVATTGHWFTGVGDPVVLLNESLDGLGDVCYRRGPILRAIDDDDVIDNDIILFWGSQKRIITGSDILGRLMRGIVQNQGTGFKKMTSSESTRPPTPPGSLCRWTSTTIAGNRVVPSLLA